MVFSADDGNELLHTDTQTHGHTERQTHRQTQRHIDRHTDRQTYGHIDTQTHTDINTEWSYPTPLAKSACFHPLRR